MTADACAPAAPVSAVEAVQVMRIELSTLPQNIPQNAIIRELEPHVLDGVQWEKHFQNQTCPSQQFLAQLFYLLILKN